MGKSFEETDVVIIGAGPVGLFAVFECGMLKMKTHVIDALDDIGGQCTALYPEKPIYDIPAYPEISGADLIQKLSDQIAPFHPQYHLNQQVISIEKQNENWLVTTNKNTQINCKAIIIAAGVGAFGPNRPPLDHIEDYEGKSIFYWVKNQNKFKGKKIAIAGGGDSAVDWANALSAIADTLWVIHRRPKFRAAPESVDKLHKLESEGKINFAIPYQLNSLEGQNGQLNKINLKTLEGEEKTIEADILLPFFGLSMNLGPILEWNLNLDKNHIIVNPSTLETNLEGIYAIGDIATYENKLKLILTGFSEAAMAAHHIYKRVFPDKELHFAYSTTKGVEELENK